MDESGLVLRDARDSDGVADWLTRLWGSTRVVGHETVFEADRLPAYVATVGPAGPVVGLVTYTLVPEHGPEALEIVTIDANPPGRGIGAAMLREAVRRARLAGVHRVVLTTTNDNLPALRFYQRHGFRLVALRPDAVTRARRLKPEIAAVGLAGIPLRDELDLELRLDGTGPDPW
jgi:ribosomal protein S18 acetylase RimI-like enzyme